jgi:hypothetical protein
VTLETNSRRRLLACVLYGLVTVVYLLSAAKTTLAHHTPFNHYALLADAWLKGSLHLPGSPPLYAGNNDFAWFEGHWYIVFPAFPALLLLPLAWIAKTPVAVRDGQFFVWIAGLAPAILFLALEKFRNVHDSRRSEKENLGLAALFGLGTVYWYCAEQGTVWFAAHIVGAVLAALYVLLAIRAEHPFWAGLVVGLGFWTRSPLLFATPFFLSQLAVWWRENSSLPQAKTQLWKKIIGFGLPLAALLVLAMAHNFLRFHRVTDFGYTYLTVGWQSRMVKWGLFSYHYLARNLGVILCSMPYVNLHPSPEAASLQINQHGLALWITSPFYFWLLWPQQRNVTTRWLYLTAWAVAIPTLLYQNSGQVQFGYRFSNDYAVFLFCLLAVGRRRLGWKFWAVGAVAIAINAFGAWTFQREAYVRYYVFDPSFAVFQAD